MLLRQAAREVVKFIPYVGSVAGGALAGTSTFALGKAFCYYYSSVHQGHVPRAEELSSITRSSWPGRSIRGRPRSGQRTRRRPDAGRLSTQSAFPPATA